MEFILRTGGVITIIAEEFKDAQSLIDSIDSEDYDEIQEEEN